MSKRLARIVPRGPGPAGRVPVRVGGRALDPGFSSGDRRSGQRHAALPAGRLAEPAQRARWLRPGILCREDAAAQGQKLKTSFAAIAGSGRPGVLVDNPRAGAGRMWIRT